MDWRVRSVAQLLVLGCLLALIDSGTAEQRVVCYYTNWSVYRPGTAKFSPQNINPYLCTHLIYAFGGFTKENTLKPFDKYQDIEKGGYAKFTGLKTYNKNLKTMLAIGGWNEGSTRFSPMVADPERRKEFVRNTVKFLRQNHFDGLDLDWEYPAFRDGGKPRDRDNYASLVQELREAYERESSKTGRPRLLLSMAVPAGIEYINKGYDIPKLNKYLDFINLLSYDYHSSYEPAVNHHSPLYPLEEDNEYNFDTELTVDYTIKHLLESGAAAEKIVLGIPTYGRSYTLFNEEATDIGSPADGPGEEGDATREKGYLAYYEICESLIDSDEWEVMSPNPNAMGPYAYKGNQWVGYDDESIVRLKAQYVTEHGLGGIMFWSIDNDDFRGKCHNRPYPLIEAAKEAMLAGSEKSGVSEKFSKPTKTRTDSNFIGRKLGAGRRRTTEVPIVVRKESPKKRVNSLRLRNRPNTQDNSDEEEPPVQANGRNKGQFFNSEEDEDVSKNSKVGTNYVRSVEYSENEEEESPRPQNQNRVRNGQGGRKKPDTSRRRSTTASSISKPVAAEAESNRITTPEPPTTPDPGTDFKCEDEGFFSHPRDCKKYFWCLDGGPGGLGIVAHHFTCPAGLVFNKAADSCDYPRNVVCPKPKPAEAPTTHAPIIAPKSRTTKIQTTTRRSTTSTTPESEYSEEYEYYDDEDEDAVPVTTTTAKSLQYKTITRNKPTASTSTAEPITTTQSSKTVTSKSYQRIPSRGSSVPVLPSIDESEEDPKVLKELIELIKKAGGIEELEKQLHLQGKSSESGIQTGSAADKANVTPATISRSLYERVLNRQAANSGTTLFRRTTVSPITVTKEVAEKLDPQASVAQKSKPSFRNGPGQAQFEGLDDIPEVKSLRRERPQYVTITRSRPSPESSNEDNEENDGDNTDGASSDEKLITNPPKATQSTQRDTPGYVDIRRSRTSTSRTNILEEENEDDLYKRRRRPVTTDTETKNAADDDRFAKNLQTAEEPVAVEQRNQFSGQEDTSSTTSRYNTIHRIRSTTQATEETSAEDDEKIINNTSKSTNSLSDIISLTTQNDKPEDESSIPNETTVGNSAMPTTTPVTLQISTTQIPNLISTDSSVENLDTLTTLLPTTVKLVEEPLTTESPLPVVSSTSTQQSLFDELISKGIATVAQPRPFELPRRTRPTTVASIPETTTSSVNSETGRVKVPSETVRLPTLKELIGYKTIVAHDYTTTTPITLSIQTLPDDSHINLNKHTKHVSETVTPVYLRELLPDKIGSTEATRVIEADDQFHKYALKTNGNNKYANGVEDNSISKSEKSQTSTDSTPPATLAIKILRQDRTRQRKPKIKLVNIPVRILESDNPVTEVILEVPESKLNSVLTSLLRVEIINQNKSTYNHSKNSKNVDFYIQRKTNSSTDRNRHEHNLNAEHESDEVLKQDANTNSFTTTTPRVSTVRGNRLRSQVSSRNHSGFYVTKSIESSIFTEMVTPSTPLQVEEVRNESTPQVSTTPNELTTSHENEFTVKSESESTTASNFYKGQSESTLQETWTSTTITSLENFDKIIDDTTGGAGATTTIQDTTTIPDIASTEYLSVTETQNSINSTTEPIFTESNREIYTHESAETLGSLSTEEYSGTSLGEIFQLNSDPDSRTTTALPLPTSTIISQDYNYYTATSTTTPDFQYTTNEQNTNSVTEVNTPTAESSSLNTSFNTPRFETTAIYDMNNELNTELYPYTETTPAESITEESNTKVTVNGEYEADFKPNTFITDEATNSDSLLQMAVPGSTITTATSDSQPEIQTTQLLSSPYPETTTIDFLTTQNDTLTSTTVYESVTDTIPTTAYTDQSEIYSSTIEDHGSVTTRIEIETTTPNDMELTTASMPTSIYAESPTQLSEISDIASTDSTTITSFVEVESQTVIGLNISGSQSTIFHSSNTDEIITDSTTTKSNEAINKTSKDRDMENSTQNSKPLVPTETTYSTFARQDLYRSPTAMPQKVLPRKRIIRKRINGIRKPYNEGVAENGNDFKPILNVNSRLNSTNRQKQRFIRRRIINHNTRDVVADESFMQNPLISKNSATTIIAKAESVQNVNSHLPVQQNNLAKNLLRHRAIVRRRPVNNNQSNQTNSSIETNISSQNNSASNDVQSTSVSSTNSNQRRRIVLKRFRYRDKGLTESSAVNASPSPSPQSLLTENVSQLNSKESRVVDELLERKGSGHDYTDDTIDSINSGSESYGTVSVYGKAELPRTESISETQLESKSAQKAEDELDDGEINLFKTRASNARRPGTLLQKSKPSTTTSLPEIEVVTTSPKLPSNIAPRRRFRLGQRPTTSTRTAVAPSQPTRTDDETLKLQADADALEAPDQTGHAQEVAVTVAVANPSSPIPPSVTGRPPFRTSVRRRISTTEAPQVKISSTVRTIIRQRQRPKPFEKVPENASVRPSRPVIIDYDYYEDSEDRIVGKRRLSEQISISSGGAIRCLDQGNFAHPTSCKKFISCARMVNGQVIGTEYTCPKRLSFDPVGGICNWSAGLGCKE